MVIVPNAISFIVTGSPFRLDTDNQGHMPHTSNGVEMVLFTTDKEVFISKPESMTRYRSSPGFHGRFFTGLYTTSSIGAYIYTIHPLNKTVHHTCTCNGCLMR